MHENEIAKQSKELVRHLNCISTPASDEGCNARVQAEEGRETLLPMCGGSRIATEGPAAGWERERERMWEGGNGVKKQLRTKWERMSASEMEGGGASAGSKRNEATRQQKLRSDRGVCR
jgi:hypothetical protein